MFYENLKTLELLNKICIVGLARAVGLGKILK